MKVRDSAKEQKFTDTYEAFVDEVYGFFYVRIGFDTALAEDLTQEVFLVVFRELSGFKSRSSVRTWIFGIARNKLNDFYRDRCRRKPETCGLDEADALCDPEQDACALAEKSFESDCVRNCLEKLTWHYQMILTLKYLDDYSIKQIAQTAGISAKAAESMLFRAKTAFIREYKTEER